MRDKYKQHKKAIAKELEFLEKQENALALSMEKKTESCWKQNLVEKIPDKIYKNLQKAFCKVFETILKNGTGIIEKAYHKESVCEDYGIRNYAF